MKKVLFTVSLFILIFFMLDMVYSENDTLPHEDLSYQEGY